jgi:hypothetical protein
VIGDNMEDKLGLGKEVSELKIGKRFNRRSGEYLKNLSYDLKNERVDVRKVENVDVGKRKKVKVNVKNIDGDGKKKNVLKG